MPLRRRATSRAPSSSPTDGAGAIGLRPVSPRASGGGPLHDGDASGRSSRRPELAYRREDSNGRGSPSRDSPHREPGSSAYAAEDSLPVLLVDESVSKRWRGWWIRNGFGWSMGLGAMAYLYAFRQPGVVLMVFVLQILMYRELVRIAMRSGQEKDLPGFGFFYYYWFAVAAYFMYARTLQVQLIAVLTGASTGTVAAGGSPMVDADDPGFQTDAADAAVNASYELQIGAASLLQQLHRLFLSLALHMTTYRVPTAFALYIIGIMAFVISLRRRRNFKYQFAQFAYCHMALIAIVVQSTSLVANAYQGLIWFFLPCALVVINDSAAYVFGFFFGRTRLIKLSPKKTWEGFIGGAAATLVFAVLVSGFLQSTTFWRLRELMLCPVEHGLGFSIPVCDTQTVAGGLFVPQPLSDLVATSRGWRLVEGFYRWLDAPPWDPIRAILQPIGRLAVSRMQVHAIFLGVIASAVAPFGGLFASGFKRALRGFLYPPHSTHRIKQIKDFSDAIPGHGGVTDRMDCQIIMGATAYVYAHYILRIGTGYTGGHAGVTATYTRIVSQMPPEDVQELYEMIGRYLYSGMDVYNHT